MSEVVRLRGKIYFTNCTLCSVQRYIFPLYVQDRSIYRKMRVRKKPLSLLFLTLEKAPLLPKTEI